MPEPGAAVLVLLGIAAFALRRKSAKGRPNQLFGVGAAGSQIGPVAMFYCQ
ncbi:MAG: PEP-CTERM sorting domain-containing protein [Pirellulales bacterium]|nr:PEP-CTERM sorting domain-containing protein [Pirellulales bacterium]